MKTIEVRHDRTQKTTTVLVDQEEITLNCLGNRGRGHALSDWKDVFFPELKEKARLGPGIAAELAFLGLAEDFAQLEDACNDFIGTYGDIEIQISHKGEVSVPVLQCRNCGFELKPHWVKCPKCKTPVAVEALKCRDCGEPLEDWMDECPACGNPVGKPEATAAEAADGTQAESGTDEEEQKYSSEAVACRKRGKELRENEDYEGAIREYSRAIELEPNYCKAYGGRGYTYSEKEEYDRAIADFTRAIKIAPDDEEAASVYYHRGEAYRHQEDYATAIADYTKAIQIKPEASFVFCGRGEAYSGNGDDDRAIKDFSKAIQLNPEYVWAFYSRGLSYQKQEEYDLSTNDLTEVIGLSPDFASAYQERGFNYYVQEDADSAIKDCTKAIGLDPGDAHNYYLRGLCYSKKEKYGAAIQDFSKAIKINSDDYRYYKERGAAYSNNKNYKAAVSDLTKAIEMSEKDDDVSREDWAKLFYNRGLAYAGLNNLDTAIVDFETAVELDPEDSDYAEILKEAKGGVQSSGFSYDEESDTISGPCPHCERTAIFRGQYDNEGLAANFATGVGIGVKALFNPIKAVSGLGSIFGVTNNNLAGVYICSACRQKVVFCDNCEAMVKFDEKINGMAVCRNCGSDCGITS